MKRRLRKKLRLGEFVEFGFEVTFELPWSDDDPKVATFWDQFIGYIETCGLYCAGACGRQWDVVVYRGNKRAATEDNRVDIEQWLGAHSEVSNLRIGPLFDIWRPA